MTWQLENAMRLQQQQDESQQGYVARLEAELAGHHSKSKHNIAVLVQVRKELQLVDTLTMTKDPDYLAVSERLACVQALLKKIKP